MDKGDESLSKLLVYKYETNALTCFTSNGWKVSCMHDENLSGEV